MKCAKKVVSDSPELMDFAIRLKNFVLNLCNGQDKFFEEVNLLQKNCETNSPHQKVFEASPQRLPLCMPTKKLPDVYIYVFEMTYGLIDTSLGLPKEQAVKLTLFAP